MKERMLTVLVPIKDGDATIVATLPAIDTNNINVIYKHEGVYKRLWLNPSTNQYEYHEVVDREFPYLGKPLEIFDFTYDAERMGSAPTITAQGVMWYADKDENGNDITLEDLWLTRNNDCHVTFNGENFYLKQVPTCSKGNEDARYKYDIDFISERVALENVYLYDVVQPFVTEKPISESAQFSFFGDVSELAKRINASLLRSGLATLELKDGVSESNILTYEEWNAVGLGTYDGPVEKTRKYIGGQSASPYRYYYPWYDGDYSAYLRGEIYLVEDDDFVMRGYQCKIGKDKKGELTTSEEKLITFEDNTIHEALQQVHDTFELQYYIYSEKDANGAFTGNTIIMIADCEHDFADVNGDDFVRDDDGIPTTASPFDYGVDNELLSKEKTNTTDKIITRITGVGSEENIPWYYPNPTADGWIKPVYKTNGVEQDIKVDYPSSEGSTPAESVRYEKYLKNRIGDVFQYGRAVTSIDAHSPVYYEYDDLNGYRYYFNYDFKVTGDNCRVIIDLKCLWPLATSVILIKKDGDEYYGIGATVNEQVVASIPAGEYSIQPKFAVNNKIYKRRADYFYHKVVVHQTLGSTTTDIIKECFSAHKDLYLYTPNSDQSTWYWHTDYSDPAGSKVSVVTPQPNKTYYAWHDYNSIDGRVDKYKYNSQKTLTKTEFCYMDVQEFVQYYMSGGIKVVRADGWYKNLKKQNLSDWGIVEGDDWEPDVFDTIEFKRLKYVTPQPNLMPEVYIKTDGERRFYNAVNYPLASGTPDAMIGEEESGGQIINQIYYKEDTTNHYDFENEYIQSRPHEHIENFDDVKPSIKGQINEVDGSTLRIDVIEEFAYDELDDDDVWESNDNGNISGEYKHPYFFAKLRPLGFNIFDLALQDDMVLSMTTGHCGACNFKIAVDENTKKNPVQIWEHDVYEGSTITTSALRYHKGELRRHGIDTTNLYYDVDGEAVQVDGGSLVRTGFIVSDDFAPLRSRTFQDRIYSADQVVNGEVGSLKLNGKNHFEGDVLTSGKFISSQQDTSENYVWIALTKDTDTYGVLMPSARPDYGDGNFSVYIRPKSIADVHTETSTDSEDEDNADKFVLTNIRLPQVYLRRAEKELSRKLVGYMYDNNYQKFNFSIKFSRIFLAENAGVDENLNENSVLYVTFNNKVYRQYVKHYTYRMSRDAVLPEIDVDMNEELSVTRTATERQAALQQQASANNNRRIRRQIAASAERLSRRTIGRNEDTIISGNLVSRDAVTSFGDLRRVSDSNLSSISDTQVDLEVNHFRRTDFQLFNGTDLKIGDSLFLPTPYKDGKSIKRRVWSESEKTFVSDSDGTFSPAFIDKGSDETRYKMVDADGKSIVPARISGHRILQDQDSNNIADGTFSPAFIDKTNERLVQYTAQDAVDLSNVIQPATKSSFQSFVTQVNTFNTSVANNIMRIRYTVEDRTGLTQLGGCASLSQAIADRVFDLKDHAGVAFWLDSSGESVSTSSICPSPVSVTWTDFNIT